MLMKRFIKKLTTAVALMVVTVAGGSAFPTSNYATQSVLASGRWVKVAVPTTGMYQITYDELSQMGFSSPANVKVFGMGGKMISEVLDGSVTDDLAQIPAITVNNKLVFYGVGPVGMTLKSDASSGTFHYERTINPYSLNGYYFLTEDVGSPLSPTLSSRTPTGSNVRATSYDYWYHEVDEINLGMSGKTFLGETLASSSAAAYAADEQCWIDCNLPGIDGSRSLCVQVSAGVLASGGSAYIHTNVAMGDTVFEVPFKTTQTRIYPKSDGSTFFNQASPYIAVPAFSNKLFLSSMRINPWIETPYAQRAESAHLDYAIITYTRSNVLAGASQVRMGVSSPQPSDIILLPDAGDNIQVWNVDAPSQPMRMNVRDYSNDDYEGKAFAPDRMVSSSSSFVMFDPTAELLSVSGYETVANQNIHAAVTPNLVIVTSTPFLAQAERVAELHRELDGMDVLVVDQKQVFNEFSSGTPDAMAVRMMCKMFYDRDSEKFRYLLLMGPGTYDNRGITGKRDNVVITYESTSSVREDDSYACDDFYGLLVDNSGYEPASDLLCLGVGRMTGASDFEMKSDVDKLEEYLRNNDYGVWRNNALLACDTGDNDLHMFQAEQTKLLMDDELATGIMVNRVFNDQFARSTTEDYVSSATSRTASEAKKHWSDLLKQGQYFMSYIGHAGPTTYTKAAHMWTVADVNSTSYKYLPIMTTACCDVARYDGGVQGIAEQMFHKRDGGAIALLTSCRAVYATDNDALNRAFIRSMFTYNSTGDFPRLGDAYMAAKRSFGTTKNVNKMAFLLLGDPALKINYPKPLFNLTKVKTYNAESVPNDVTAYPLETVHLEAQVVKPGTTEVDATFNGDATLTIYDRERVFKSNVANKVDNRRDTISVYYPRNKLVEIAGRVNAGVFTADVTMPRYTEAIAPSGLNTALLISLYANRDNSTEMVNGNYNKLRMGLYDESKASVDEKAPVVETMAFVGHESEDLPVISSAATINIVVTDNLGLNVQTHSVGNKMQLSIDGGATTVADIASVAVLSDGARRAVINYPLSDLEVGDHTATFVAYDLHGNQVSRSLNFTVEEFAGADLNVNDRAVTTSASFDFVNPTTEDVTVRVKVLDIAGNLVWTTVTDSFPVTWDLKDLDGNAVEPGLYKYSSIYRGANAYGGTPLKELIVLPAVQ